MNDRRCGTCGVAEGELHEPGCDLERCPKCGGQLLSCGCTLVDHKRVPWVWYDLGACSRCGRQRTGHLYTDPAEADQVRADWERIRPTMFGHDLTLCRPCFDEVVALVTSERSPHPDAPEETRPG